MISGTFAVIADGNRRWASKNGLPSSAGHLQGALKLQPLCEWAIRKRLENLIVFAFSAHNWRRQKTEVDDLFSIAERYFSEHLGWYVQSDVNVTFVGRRDRLPPSMIRMMTQVEQETSGCYTLNLFVCVDYSGREEIMQAARSMPETVEQMSDVIEYVLPTPDVIFRTGGRHRLSDFMLWQAAFAEIEFSDTLFPDLDAGELDAVYDRARAAVKNFGV